METHNVTRHKYNQLLNAWVIQPNSRNILENIYNLIYGIIHLEKL